MECSNRQLLSAYHDGELDPAAQTEMGSHLAACPACAAELAQLAALSGLFAAQRRPGVSQIARYRLHDKTESVMRSDVLRIARAMQAIAACVLVGASIWLMQSPATVGGPQEASADNTGAVQAAPPWVDVAVTASAETHTLDATTPAAAWYLADYSTRGDDWH